MVQMKLNLLSSRLYSPTHTIQSDRDVEEDYKGATFEDSSLDN